MTTIAINRNQHQLLDEIISIMPQYDGVEVINVLKRTLSGLRSCKKAQPKTVIKQAPPMTFSPEVTALMGIIPDFTDEELATDEHLRHILEH